MSWTPSSMGSELLQWLKADALTGLSDTDPVSTFTDSSANSRTVTGSSTARPLYRTSQVNSLPALSFDGSNDAMASPSSYTLAAQSIACCCVCKCTTLKDYNFIYGIHNSATFGWQPKVHGAMVYSAGNCIAVHNPAAGSRYIWPTIVTAGQWFILTTQLSSIALGCAKNGAAYAGSSSGTHGQPNYSGSAWTTLGYIGLAGSYLNGMIAELVVMDNSCGDHIAVEGYLSDKYAISLDTSHRWYGVAPTAGPRDSGGSLLTGVKNKGIRVS